jgi:hypothetical protein
MFDGVCFCSLGFASAGVVGVGMCARPRTHFLCFAKESKQRKASRIRRPATRARCVAQLRRGARKLGYRLKHARPLIRRSLRYSPPHNGEGVRTVEQPNTKTNICNPQGRAMARPCGLLYFSHAVLAGLSSAAAGGSGRALFERSEFSPTPSDASSARNRVAALTAAAFSFAYFSLGKQRKVSARSGAHPDTPRKPMPRFSANQATAFNSFPQRHTP